MTFFFANKRYHPKLNLDSHQSTNNQKAQDLTQHMEKAQDLTQHMEKFSKQLKSNLLVSQKAQRPAANLHRTPAPAYQVRNQVWLNSKNIKTQRPFKKLDNKWIGPFTIAELVSKRACQLELSVTLQIHLVFHVFLLHCTAQNPVPGQSNQCPSPVNGTDMDDSNIYKVENIIYSQAPQGKQGFKYLVK